MTIDSTKAITLEQMATKLTWLANEAYENDMSHAASELEACAESIKAHLAPREVSDDSTASDLVNEGLDYFYKAGDEGDKEYVRAIRAHIAALQADRQRGGGVSTDERACAYAERLAVSLWRQHYAEDAPQWEPLSGDLIGLLSQIDYMLTSIAQRGQCGM